MVKLTGAGITLCLAVYLGGPRAAATVRRSGPIARPGLPYAQLSAAAPASQQRSDVGANGPAARGTRSMGEALTPKWSY